MAAIDLSDIKKLSVAERLQLVDAIWDSLEQDNATTDLFPLTAAQRQVLEERLAEF